MENLGKDIKELVAKVIKKKTDELDPGADIFKDYGVDSLLGVEILANIDKKYGLDVPETSVREIRTINDIIRLTSRLLADRGKQ